MGHINHRALVPVRPAAKAISGIDAGRRRGALWCSAADDARASAARSSRTDYPAALVASLPAAGCVDLRNPASRTEVRGIGRAVVVTLSHAVVDAHGGPRIHQRPDPAPHLRPSVRTPVRRCSDLFGPRGARRRSAAATPSES